MIEFVTLQAGSISDGGAFAVGKYDYDIDSISSGGAVTGPMLVYTVGNLTNGNKTSPALKTTVSTILKVR